MNITLFNNSSPPNYVDKVLTQVASLQGVLRQPTSIINPSIVIQRGSPTGFNYALIPEYNRYYFVTGVSSEINGLIAISLHVDVLMTYKEAIRAATGIVRRQEYEWNLYLQDENYKIYQNTKHRNIAFPRGFGDNEFSYILTLAGNSPTTP